MKKTASLPLLPPPLSCRDPLVIGWYPPPPPTKKKMASNTERSCLPAGMNKLLNKQPSCEKWDVLALMWRYFYDLSKRIIWTPNCNNCNIIMTIYRAMAWTEIIYTSWSVNFFLLAESCNRTLINYRQQAMYCRDNGFCVIHESHFAATIKQRVDFKIIHEFICLN